LAITGLEYLVFSSLRHGGLLPPKPKVLELGESNWYGDIPTEKLQQDIAQFAKSPADQDALQARLKNALAMEGQARIYEIARVFFKLFLDHESYTAIDPGTPSSQYGFDLNMPVPLQELFDVTINIGTAEHVFNVLQFFKTAHERTAPGGLMIHSSPFTGWPDHGFYCFQPTFFYDIARMNRYQVMSFVIAQFNPLQFVQVNTHEEIPALLKSGKLPAHTHINVVFRKPPDAGEFAIPIQGYYAGALSPEGMKSWGELR